MSYYIVASYNVTDPEQFGAYGAQVGPLLAKHGGELVSLDFAPSNLEGEARSNSVILRFPSQAQAEAWYNDPEYAVVRELRFASTQNGQMLLVEGVPEA